MDVDILGDDKVAEEKEAHKASMPPTWGHLPTSGQSHLSEPLYPGCLCYCGIA